MSPNPLDSGRELCEALGLDPNRVQSIVIRWTATDSPRARVTLVDFDGAEVVRTIGRYRLTPITAKAKPDARTLGGALVDGIGQLKAKGVPLT